MPAPLTSALDTILGRMAGVGPLAAVWWREREWTYRELLGLIEAWEYRLDAHGIGSGAVCGVVGEFSPASCALFFALMRRAAVAVPLTARSRPELESLRALAGIRWMIQLDRDGPDRIDEARVDDNALVAEFAGPGRPGLIVFTSGSSGRPKGILHDVERVLGKFIAPRPGWRTLLFLMMDHFGGFNTFVSAFAYGGCAICVHERSPEAVCRVLEGARVQLLPTTPTFLRLLLLSDAWKRYDLSSVELVTYGAEPMPQSTLDRIRAVFPKGRFKQTYGLSEIGVLHSRSPDAGSTWLAVGGQGFETRVVEGVLWIRSASSMVGYLNAPSPFDGDGWLNTGDEVEEKEGLIRFRGRKSEVVNVGGQKVFPSEVEAVLLEAPNVRDAVVYGIPHALLGQVPCAQIALDAAEPPDGLQLRLRRHCAARLAKYKIPMRFIVDAGVEMNERLKKPREAG